MRALTVRPGVADSAELTEIPEPIDGGPVLVEAIRVGVCGTDREIMAGEYGTAPEGADRLVLGHESLGRVLADASGTFAAGELVVGIVRHPDPEPCANCAVGEWDMCRNGRYTEHGIAGRHGFASERFRLEPDHAVGLPRHLEPVGVLLEPTTVVAKAWEHIDRIGHRARWSPQTAVVTGAGPIGLLAALLGALRGMEVHVVDTATSGIKPDLVAALGATYHHTGLHELGMQPDVALECTGVPSVVIDAMAVTGPNGITCLTGVSTAGRSVELDAGGLNRTIVLQNDVVFGSVNANRRHYEQAAEALAGAEEAWLRRLITRQVPIADFADAFTRQDGDVKVTLELGSP